MNAGISFLFFFLVRQNVKAEEYEEEREESSTLREYNVRKQQTILK